MLCTTCRRALLKRIHSTNSQTSRNLLNSNNTSRSITTTSETKAAAAPSTSSAPTSPSAELGSQPFSEPFFSSSASPTAVPLAPGSPRPNPSAPKKLASSVAGGTPLTALMYTKASQGKPLLALEDDQYPPWLWTLLDARQGGAGDGTVDGTGIDLDSMTKKMRAKYERKQAKLMANMEKPVPLHEQSRDLTGPGDDARTSVERRGELTRSMRQARRKEIRETNFLKSM